MPRPAADFAVLHVVLRCSAGRIELDGDDLTAIGAGNLRLVVERFVTRITIDCIMLIPHTQTYITRPSRPSRPS